MPCRFYVGSVMLGRRKGRIFCKVHKVAVACEGTIDSALETDTEKNSDLYLPATNAGRKKPQRKVTSGINLCLGAVCKNGKQSSGHREYWDLRNTT